MIRGWERPSGAVGIRNHLLVLPTVVCSGHVVAEIAGERATPIVHQHGCSVVGADVADLAGSLAALVDAPNVGAAVLVGLGCETIQTSDVVEAVTETDRPLVVLTIQGSEGSEETVRQGRAAVERLGVALDSAAPTELGEDRLVVGLDQADAPFATELETLVRSVGARLVVSTSRVGEPSHLELTGKGAAVIVAVRRQDDGPCGFAVAPVVSATVDEDLFAAMPDDYDILISGDPLEDAAAIWGAVLSAARGVPTASERRGDRDVVFPRSAMSM